MSIYLGSTRISPIVQGDTMEAYVKNGGRFGYSLLTDLSPYVKPEYTKGLANLDLFFAYANRITSSVDIDMSDCTSASSMFQGCDELVDIPTINAPNLSNAFGMFRYSPKIINSPKINAQIIDTSNMFRGCTALKNVGEFDASNILDNANMFFGCPNLEEIHIKNIGVSLDISSSTKFTREALVEIIGNLKIVTVNQTLTMGATNLAKLTDSDKAIATGKGWTLA